MADMKTQQESPKPKSGIRGCLLYPLFFLILQPLAFVILLLKPKPSALAGYSFRYVVVWMNVILDVVVVGVMLFLLFFFLRKKVVLPGLFIMALVFLFTLFTLVSMILPPPGYGAGDPISGFMVLLIQCFILIPFFVLSKQVKNTFTVPLDPSSAIDRLLLPFQDALERFYAWLVRKGRLIFPLVLGFVVIIMGISAVLGMLAGRNIF